MEGSKVIQKHLSFAGTAKRPLVTLSESDRRFLEMTPLLDVPDLFWCETRAQRLGCSVSEIMAMRTYDRSREIAEEVALLGLGMDAFETMPPTRLDDSVLDASAKRETADRMAAFNHFLSNR
jgi:hypothetical protein